MNTCTMNTASLLPHQPFLSLWTNRTLVARLVVRDIQNRYRGTMLGLAWALGVPLATVAVYLIVFVHVLSVQWNGGNGPTGEYALILFASVIVFNFFAECLNRAPGLMLEDTSYIKKVVFPLEILPWVSIFVALFHSFLSACILLACYLALLGLPPLSALAAPMACLPLVLFTLGLSWLFSALGVYLRDLRPLVNVATTFMLFLSPVFYPLSAVKGLGRTLFCLNPLTQVLEDVRGGLFWGILPDLPMFLTALAGSAVVAWLGFCWFMKTRQGFADVV